MRSPRFWFAMSLALLLPVHAHASLLAKLFFMLRSSTSSTPAPKPKLVGQETRAFMVHKAHVQDLLAPVQNYLNGISKLGGSVQIREADNALVATDYPENLMRLSALIPEIDKVYDNDNPQAREMLVTQNLMKAIRNHPDSSVVIAHGGERPMVNNGTRNVPLSLYGPGSLTPSLRHAHTRDEDEMSPLPKRRWINNPTLSQFEVVGWMQDEQGYTIVLSNQGARFLYRQGKVRGGYNPNATPLEGIHGAIENHQLILNDGQNHVSLNMLKWRTL